MLQLAAACIGLGLSLYLVVQHTRLETGIQDTTSFCSMGEVADCDVVNASPYSKVFGIPIASFGGLYFLTILLLGLFANPKKVDHGYNQKLIVLLSLVALVVELYLSVVQALFIKSFCLLCLGTYLCNLFIIITACWSLTEKRDLWNGFLSALQWKPLPPPSYQKLATLAVLVFVGGGLMLYYPVHARQNSDSQKFFDNLDAYFEAFQNKPVKRIALSESDASYGSPKAPIQIVEFSDYQCPFCQKAAFVLHAVKKTLPDEIRLVFKNYPLDSSCNPSMPNQLHPMACRLAQLGACANEKQQFWAYHDTIFFGLNRTNSFPTWETVSQSLSPIFSREEITQCLTSENSRNQIDRDLREGKNLAVSGTPAIFINGRQLDPIPLTIPILLRIMEMELERVRKN